MGISLKLTTDYDSATDTVDVSYALNGEPPVSAYSGTGIDGRFGDVITSFVEVEVFKFGDNLPDQTVATIDRWSIASTSAPTTLGDSNGDGIVNTLDIDPFVLALTDAGQYAIDFPAVDFHGANDSNDDGVVNTLDIDAFVALLTGPSAAATPEPSGASVLVLTLAGVVVLGRFSNIMRSSSPCPEPNCESLNSTSGRG